MDTQPTLNSTVDDETTKASGGEEWICGICETTGDSDYTIECGDCKQAYHYFCTKLPIYVLDVLCTTNRKFTCEPCHSSGKWAGNQQWRSKAFEAIQQHKQYLENKGRLASLTDAPEVQVLLSDLGAQNESDKQKDLHSVNKEIECKCQGACACATLREKVSSRKTQATVKDKSSGNKSDGNPQGKKDTTMKNPKKSDHKPEEYICKKHLRDKCTNRRNCEYSHPVNKTINDSKNYEEICKYHLRDVCRNRANCEERHPRWCRHFIHDGFGREGCYKKQNCSLDHPHICKSSWNYGICKRNNCQHRHLYTTRTPMREQRLLSENGAKSNNASQRYNSYANAVRNDNNSRARRETRPDQLNPQLGVYRNENQPEREFNPPVLRKSEVSHVSHFLSKKEFELYVESNHTELKEMKAMMKQILDAQPIQWLPQPPLGLNRY